MMVMMIVTEWCWWSYCWHSFFLKSCIFSASLGFQDSFFWTSYKKIGLMKNKTKSLSDWSLLTYHNVHIEQARYCSTKYSMSHRGGTITLNIQFLLIVKLYILFYSLSHYDVLLNLPNMHYFYLFLFHIKDVFKRLYASHCFCLLQWLVECCLIVSNGKKCISNDWLWHFW